MVGKAWTIVILKGVLTIIEGFGGHLYYHRFRVVNIDYEGDSSKTSPR